MKSNKTKKFVTKNFNHVIFMMKEVFLYNNDDDDNNDDL